MHGNPALVAGNDLPLSKLPGYIQFNGAYNYVEIPAFTNATEEVTLSCWARSDTEDWNNNGCLVSKRNSFILHPKKGRKDLIFQAYLGNRWRAVTYVPFEITSWHHYAGTFDGKRFTFT